MIACFRDSFLDMDKPFCDVGFDCLLLHLLSLLWRHHLVRRGFYIGNPLLVFDQEVALFLKEQTEMEFYTVPLNNIYMGKKTHSLAIGSAYLQHTFICSCLELISTLIFNDGNYYIEYMGHTLGLII